MTVFFCSKCGTELTAELTRLPSVPDIQDLDRARDKSGHVPSTVPLGHYAVDPEPWGAPFVPLKRPESLVSARSGVVQLSCGGLALTSAGLRNTMVVHPGDVPGVLPLPGGENGSGCCGPTGTQGPNHACHCGTRIATLAADCLGPYELRLDPVRVYAFDQ